MNKENFKITANDNREISEKLSIPSAEWEMECEHIAVTAERLSAIARNLKHPEDGASQILASIQMFEVVLELQAILSGSEGPEQ